MKNKLMAGVSIMLMVALVVGVIAVNAPTDLSMANTEGVLEAILQKLEERMELFVEFSAF